MGISEQLEAHHDNPFFRRYGTLVSRCFPSGAKVDDPIVITPRLSADLRPNETEDEKRDFHILLEDLKGSDVKRARKTIHQLREALLQEEEARKTGGATPTIRQLHEFNEALKSGSEAMLDENPFYELTVLVIRINMRLLKENFAHVPNAHFPDLPHAIRVSRSLSHILGRRGTLISPQERFSEMMGKLLSLGKNAIGILLFILSTLTTAKGFSDLVQDDSAVALFGPGLVGPENESLRLGLAILTGLTLSSIILDFKARIFQGMADVGRVLKGVAHAFKRNTILLPLCLFLTGVSIWTNYDGIVLMVTKKDDLSNQWRMIENKVRLSLGDPRRPNPDNPSSLNDLKVMIEQRVTQLVKAFEQVPLDERLGSASSGIAKKGPRYWGKHYVVYGGYQPGEQDVSSQMKRRSRTAKKIDQMLRNTEIDLDTSLQEKMRRIVRSFSRQHHWTHDKVLGEIAVLEQMLYMDPFSPSSVSRAFKVEAYHINEVMQEIITPMEAHTKAYAAVVGQIITIANQHIELLKKVDKAGLAKKSSYNIDVSIDIPNLDSLKALKNLSIPTAERRNLAQLKNLLFETYGVSLGGFILMLILFIAISMDLSDPIFFSAMVARWGQRDRTFLEENTERFINWEEKFVAELRSYFLRPEIRALMPRISPPRSQVFRNAFNHYLEKVNPRTKAASDRTVGERFRFWFSSLFQETRIEPVTAYNIRRTTIERYLFERKTLAPEFINHIFKALLRDFSFGNDTFEKRYHQLLDGLVKHDKQLTDELNHLQQKYGELSESEEIILAGKSSTVSPVSGLGWQLRQMRLNTKSRGQINAYAQYAPGLIQLLGVRMPEIRDGLISPLNNTLERMPNRGSVEIALEIREQLDLFKKLEEAGVVMLGLSRFQGFQLNEGVVNTVIESLDVQVITDVFKHHKDDGSQLVTEVDDIAARLERIYQLVVTLVNSQEVLIHTLTRLHRTHLNPLKTSLDRMSRIGSAVEHLLGLDSMKQELTVIETCLLEVWATDDEQSINSDNQEHEAAKHAARIRKSFQSMLSRIEQHQLSETDASGFDLTLHVDNLTKRMELAKSRVDEHALRLLTIDKSMSLLDDRLEGIIDITERVQSVDKEIGLAIAAGNSQEQTLRRRHFLEDNRLFFRTIHLQVESIRAQSEILVQDFDLFEPHTLTLSESLYNRTLKINEFLQMSLDFLTGRRRSMPIVSAPKEEDAVTVDNLMVAKPGKIRCINVLAQEQVLDLSDIKENKEEIAALISTLQENCRGVKDRVREIGLQEWLLLQTPIPEPKVLQRLDEHRGDVHQAIADVENILCRLEGMLDKNQPDIPLRIEILQEMHNVAEQISKELDLILNQISDASPGDRRSQKPDDSKQTEDERRDASDRRSTPRSKIPIPVDLKLGSKQDIITGRTFDVNKQALCLEIEHTPDIMKDGMLVEFRFVPHSGESQWFSGTVLRAMGPMVIITLQAHHDVDYVTAVRKIALTEYGEDHSILDVLPTTAHQ
ncbi:MAG: hypothetical protein HQL50_03635 [Magnetococcales bacterium]|nr:hypothetical protein [Magnetococcales bacterium]